jgi:membrane dipeptidase
MIIFDAHLDLAMNALEWNRDLTRPVSEIRQRELGLTDKPDRGRGTVSLPEMRRGGVGLCVATQIARYVKPGNPRPGWNSPGQAWAQTQGQLAWYRTMEEAGQMVQIHDAAGLDEHLMLWTKHLAGHAPSSRLLVEGQDGGEGVASNVAATSRESLTLAVSASEAEREKTTPPPIGYVLSLEGADSLLTVAHLERSYAQGLRALGPAHYGPGSYAQGTDASGGLGPRGRELLAEMERLGIILDVTHLCDESFWEALDHFHGPIWASHSNCRALVPHHRQFTDEQITVLIERGAVMGAALDAWMLVPGWIKGKTTPETVGLKLERVIEHIDHICQLAGNAHHCGIGSDLDGAFGREQCPADLDTIVDLARVPALLSARGFGAEEVERIAHRNFTDFLKGAWRTT